MKNIKTGEISDMHLSFAEREDLLETGEYEQQISGINIVSGVKSLNSRTPDGFKDLLKNMKDKRGRPAKNMTIAGDK
jgi:hypothetical protein